MSETITKESIITQLSNDLSEPNLNIFKNSVDISLDDDSEDVLITVPDTYLKQWIENKCFSLIRSYFNAHSFRIIVKERTEATDQNQLELFKAPESSPIQISKFNPQLSFDKFIVGNNNRFAYAAAVAVAQQPAKAYNPLYIYGNVGIGKTHLLHAIANEISKTDLNICLVTSEKFTNDFQLNLKIIL